MNTKREHWENRLYANTPIPIGDECAEWMGTRGTRGYGTFYIDRQRGRMAAHRLIFQLANGPIPDAMQVCHRCDNPPCVRLDHLFLGTAADNAADREAKGRGAKRVRNRDTHPSTRVDSKGVRDVWARRNAGEPVRSIAETHGVAVDTIYKILKSTHHER